MSVTYIVEKEKDKINTWSLVEREWHGIGRPDYRILKYLTFSEVLKTYKDNRINRSLWGKPPKPPVEIK